MVGLELVYPFLAMSKSSAIFSVGVQTPFGLPLQGMQPAGVFAPPLKPVHEAGGGGLQVPLTQVFGAAQTIPQPPQLLLSVFGLTQFDGPPSAQVPH